MSEEDFCVKHINDRVGRGIVALRSFRKGETIFRERPLVSCQFSWNREYGYSACDFCLEPLETAQENVTRLTQNPNIVLPHSQCCETRKNFHVRCPECETVTFCSESCLKSAKEQYHSVLCSKSLFVKLEEIWKTLHYPPETASIMLIARILASVVSAKSSEERDAIVDRYAGFMQSPRNDDEEIGMKLLGPQFESQLEQLRTATIEAFGRDETSISALMTPDDFVRLFALLGRNGQGIGTSPFARWVRNVEKLRSSSNAEKKHMDDLISTVYCELDKTVGLEFLNTEGSGLYELQSRCNHSCNPNAKIEFPNNNHELVVNASSDIVEGEEILISYLDEHDLDRSRHSRRKILKENYLFMCECSKCESQIHDPDETSEEDMSTDEEEEIVE